MGRARTAPGVGWAEALRAGAETSVLCAGGAGACADPLGAGADRMGARAGACGAGVESPVADAGAAGLGVDRSVVGDGQAVLAWGATGPASTFDSNGVGFRGLPP